MKTWDAIVIGGGVIGLTIALELNKNNYKALLIERGETGREASHAAGGMLAYCDPDFNELVTPLALQSVALYPEFVRELQDETKVHIDFRQDGTIFFPEGDEVPIRGKVLSTDLLDNGKIVIGATVEEAGFDKQVLPDVIQDLHQKAANLFPALGEARMLEAWAGLRPGTPDGLPMIGETSYRGYLAATGHFRDGIMLAPVTAKIIRQLVTGETPEMNLLPFSPERFS